MRYIKLYNKQDNYLSYTKYKPISIIVKIK